jgi:hypothetical protein
MRTGKRIKLLVNKDQQNTRIKFKVLGFGMLAGLLASASISGLILVVEKTIDIPVGTFYLVLVSSLTQSHVESVNMIMAGLLLHLFTGTIIGAIISIPFATRYNKILSTMHKYAPIYGLCGLVVGYFESSSYISTLYLCQVTRSRSIHSSTDSYRHCILITVGELP